MEQREFVDGIRSSGEALLTLINDILDFSKIEAGRLELESRAFELRPAVEKTVALFTARAREKGLRLTVTIDPRVPAAIAFDAGRLRQILVNLLGNAVEFTEAGEVSLTITACDAPGNWRRISFLVRDTGPGIAPEHQQRIFESFSQVDASIGRKFGGTGLLDLRSAGRWPSRWGAICAWRARWVKARRFRSASWRRRLNSRRRR